MVDKAGAREAYCTLLFSDDYVIGAIVLAGQLRQLDPDRPILCLVNRDGVSSSSIIRLTNLFDQLIFVEAVDAGESNELSLLSRPELRYATTKLHLWSLPFAKVIYLDADTLPLLSLAHLFELDLPNAHTIGAAPDCGWPDMFNSGVLVLRPDPAIAKDLIKNVRAQKWIDGTDQGLLNEQFAWTRIPFIYNVTVNASYEYLPAYRRFKNEIHILHFIGKQKPWNQTAEDSEASATWWTTAEKYLSRSEPPQSEAQPRYNPDRLITVAPDYWNAKMHAPIKKTQPEGEQLSHHLSRLTVEDQSAASAEDHAALPQPKGSKQPPKSTSDREQPSERGAAVAKPASWPARMVRRVSESRHTYPAYGPPLLHFPFERTDSRPPVERQF